MHEGDQGRDDRASEVRPLTSEFDVDDLGARRDRPHCLVQGGRSGAVGARCPGTGRCPARSARPRRPAVFGDLLLQHGTSAEWQGSVRCRGVAPGDRAVPLSPRSRERAWEEACLASRAPRRAATAVAAAEPVRHVLVGWTDHGHPPPPARRTSVLKQGGRRRAKPRHRARSHLAVAEPGGFPDWSRAVRHTRDRAPDGTVNSAWRAPDYLCTAPLYPRDDTVRPGPPSGRREGGSERTRGVCPPVDWIQ